MRRGELRLLGVLRPELVSDGVEELDVRLLGIFGERTDESPAHRSCSLARLACVSRGLGVLASLEGGSHATIVTRECQLTVMVGDRVEGQGSQVHSHST